jgi:hypothetical protein
MKNTNENKPLLSPDEQEDYEERAAIIEFMGKTTRQSAETLALRLTLAKRTKNATAQS